MTDPSDHRDATTGARAFNAASWAVLACPVLNLTLALALVIYRLSVPGPGWSLDTRSQPGQQFIFTQKLTDAPSPIQSGDALVAIEDQPVGAIVQRALTGHPQPPPGWVMGGTVHYTVRRAGSLLTFPVPLVPSSAEALRPHTSSDVVNIVTLLISMSFALFVFLRRPQDAAARILFLFCTLLPTGAVNNNQADLFDSGAYWAEILLNRLDWIFIVTPLLMHLTLVFPVPKLILRRYGRLVPALLYGLAPGIFLLMVAVSGDWATAFWPAYNILAPLWSGLGLLVMIASVAHSVRTGRDPVPRAQMRWVALGLLVGLVTPSVLYAVQPLLDPGSTWIDALGYVVFLALPLSLGIAILRYRLWDIDGLLNRTLVYGTLTISIVGLYVLVVGALGRLLQMEGNPLISLAATGLVAVLFGPLRERLQRLGNHLLYGQRDEPYTVLSRLGQRLEGALAPDTVLPTIVETVATALKLPYAAIVLPQEAGEAVVAAQGTPVATPLRVPLVYQGTPVGQLLLAPRTPGEAWSRADRRLLADLAHQAGPAVHDVLLARDLQRLMGDLQRSRERLVLAREEERRRLRRDLHDELAPTLAALALTASTAGDLISTDPPAAAELIARLHRALRGAVGDIRRLVYDLRPPVLDELGLVAAIRERAAQYAAQGRGGTRQDSAGGLQVEVDAPETLPPLPAAAEVAAYRIVQEALMNAARHAGAQHCRIRLAVAGDLEVEVLDDGTGIPAEHRVGVGLGSMRERAEELGGRCVIQQRGPAGGTRVWACLPLEGGADGAATHPHCG